MPVFNKWMPIAYITLTVQKASPTVRKNSVTVCTPMAAVFRAVFVGKKWIRIFGYGSIRVFEYLQVCDIMF